MAEKSKDKKYNEPTVENVLNKNGNNLPFGYYHPGMEGNLTWNCDFDTDGKVTSVFCMKLPDGGVDKKCAYLKDVDEARKYRDTLVEEGWLKTKPPEVVVKRPDGSETPLNRKERRYLERKLSKMNSKNPFEDK